MGTNLPCKPSLDRWKAINRLEDAGGQDNKY